MNFHGLDFYKNDQTLVQVNQKLTLNGITAPNNQNLFDFKMAFYVDKNVNI